MIDSVTNLSCDEKRSFAEQVNQVNLKFDGETVDEGTNTSKKNMFRSEMYYVAIMDCDSNIYTHLGNIARHRVEFKVGLTDENMSQFSFEK